MREVEEWREVAGYEGLYEVSSFGRARSLDRIWSTMHPTGEIKDFIRKGRILKSHKPGAKYPQVTLAKAGTVKTFNLHALVCTAFHGQKPSPQHEAAHGDGDAHNCRSDNLRWATKLENAQDKQRHGTNYRGSRHHTTTLTEGEVMDVFERYWVATKGKTELPPYGYVVGLATDFDTSIHTIENIIYLRTWKTVTLPLLRKLESGVIQVA